MLAPKEHSILPQAQHLSYNHLSLRRAPRRSSHFMHHIAQKTYFFYAVQRIYCIKSEVFRRRFEPLPT